AGRARRHPEMLPDPVLDLEGELRTLFQEFARVVLALADAFAVVAVPGAGLVDDARGHAKIDDLARSRDAGAIEDVEFGRLEGWRNLVLDDLDAGFVADDLVALLDRADPADVEAHRRVELERIAAGGGFGVAEHDADLHADLVDEDDGGVGAVDVAGELAQGLRHQAGLEAREGVAHLAFDLGLGREGGDRVDDDEVDRARTHQRIGDLEGLLAGIG